MTKISVSDQLFPKVNLEVQDKKNSYKSLKAQYEKARKKIEKTDFANAIVVLKQELETLELLKIKAFAENKMDEGEWIDIRTEEIKKIISAQEVEIIANNTIYNMYGAINIHNHQEYQDTKKEIEKFIGKYSDESKKTASGAISLFKEKGLDEAMKIVSALSTKNGDEEKLDISPEDVEYIKTIESDLGPDASYPLAQLAKFIGYYQDEDKEFIIDNIYKLAENGFIPNNILSPLLIDDKQTSNPDGFIDLDKDLAQHVIDDLIQIKNDFPKIDIREITTTLDFLNNDFEDRTSAVNILYQLLDKLEHMFLIDSLYLSTPIIINRLTVKNADNKASISKKSADFVCKLKDKLIATRDNESKERNSLIIDDDSSGLPKMLDFGIKSDKPLDILLKDYNRSVSSIEDNIIYKYLSEFMDKKGEIDSKSLRTIINLREAGITYGSLIELTKSCINKDGSINASKLKTICDLKKAGALSKDVGKIVDACDKDENGNILQSDADICSALSSVYVNGSRIVKTLPEYRKYPELIDLLEQYEDVYKYVNANGINHLAETKDGLADEFSLEILKSLIDVLKTPYNYDVVEEIMKLSKDENGRASEAASDICSVLSENNESPERIISALKMCSDGEGCFDEKLTDILWMLSRDNTYFELTEKILKSCRFENGDLNHKKAEYIERLIKQGESPIGIVNALSD